MSWPIVSDDGSVAHPSPDRRDSVEVLNFLGSMKHRCISVVCVMVQKWPAIHRGGTGSWEEWKEKADWGRGIKELLCQSGTHSCDWQILHNKLPLSWQKTSSDGGEQLHVGGQCWPPQSCFSRSLDVVLFFKASCLIQIKHILSHFHPASFGEYLFVKQTQLDFQIYITCLWSNF